MVVPYEAEYKSLDFSVFWIVIIDQSYIYEPKV